MWFALQIVVALAVFVAIGETVGIKEFGLAPAIVSMGAAFGVTALLSWLIDSVRRFRVSQQFDGGADGRGRALRRLGDGSQIVSRPRIGQDRRKLPEIAP